MKSKQIASFFSWVLGIIFLLAAFSKTNDPISFHNQLLKISFLQQWQAGVISILLPALELVLGICLLFRLYWKEASFISSTLLIIFLIYAVFNKESVSGGCSCMKVTVPIFLEMTGTKVILRDLVLLSASCFLNFNNNSPR